MSREVDDDIVVTDQTPHRDRESRPSSRTSSHKDNDDFVDATSNTVTPASEPADSVEGTKGVDSSRDFFGLKREKSPLRLNRRLSPDGTESLTEISLDDSTANESLHFPDTNVDVTTATLGKSPTTAGAGPPELPPRKRGSVSSVSSGVLTPPIHPQPTALPPRRGPFGWLRSASTSTKAPSAPALPPRTSVASVNYGPTTLPNIDLLIARLEEQSKLVMEGDDKVKEEYAVGNEELRRSFERIQREHQPSEGEEDEIDWDLWNKLVASPQALAATSPLDLQRALLSGIPSPLRGTIWQILSASKNPDLEQVYTNVLLSTSSPQEKLIRKDISRTFPKQDYFRHKEGPNGQEGLFNVCKAYSLYDPEVNYVQGIAFIVGPLLLNMPEAEAFCLLVRLMKGYHLRQLFLPEMPGLHLHLYQYDRLIEEHLPAVHVHLARQGVRSHMYASQWFLTLFAYKFPMNLVVRILDIVIAEGLEAILRFGVAVMKKNAETVLELEFEKCLDFLQTGLFDIYKIVNGRSVSPSILSRGSEPSYRANDLVNDAYAIKLTPAQLQKYALDYAEFTRLELERASELETLKSNNGALTLQVKRLEQSLAELNREHIELANAMVQGKMENAKLADENEALKEEVVQLKQMVDVQPAEVEAKLKDEMDRIMERNLEVMSMNRELEEQVADLERELVETKLQFAQVHQNHEALTRKWNELRKALD